MKSEYQAYLERQAQIENSFDATAVASLRTFILSLPIHLRGQVLRSLSDSFHVDKVIAAIGGYSFEGALADKGVFYRALFSQQWSRGIVDGFISFFEKSKGGTYIDIGANIGLTVVPVSKGGATRSYAVEGVPENFGMLQRNLLRNGVANCTAFAVAIYNANTTVEFELSERNFGDHRVRARRETAELYDESKRSTVSVPAVRCDDLFQDAKLAGPLAIKSDIQGADGFIFSDGATVLQKCDFLISEFWPYALDRMGFTTEQMYGYFKQYFSYGGIVDDDGKESGGMLAPVDQLIDQLKERFASLHDPNASAKVRTSHVNVILAKVKNPN